MSGGMLGHVGIGRETTWGTAVAASTYVEAMSESLATAIARFETRNIVGGIHEADDSPGVARHEGDIVAAAHPANVGHFLMGAFGVNSVTAVLSGTFFSNKFTPAATLAGSLNALPGYTVEVFRPAATNISSSFQYAGCQVNGISLSVAPNQDLRATASMIAKTRRFITKTTPTFPGSPVQPFMFDTASISLASTAVTRIEALTVAISNNLEGVPTLNVSSEVAKIRRNGPMTVALSGTLEFEDLTDFNAFVNQTEQSVSVSFFRANSFQLLIEVPRAVFTEYPVQISGRDRLLVNFGMKGRYHSGSGHAISATLTTTNTF